MKEKKAKDEDSNNLHTCLSVERFFVIVIYRLYYCKFNIKTYLGF